MSRPEQLVVKVCGLRDARNMDEIAKLAPDYIGLIFYARSPRAIQSGTYAHISTPKVGVFVDAPKEVVLEKVHSHKLVAVQLHGSESPDYCADLKKSSPSSFKIFKAFRIHDETDLAPLSAYTAVADIFLLDSKGEKYGGNGKPFNWELLTNSVHHPFMLSGGITEADAVTILSIDHPYLWGVDINSCFETAPGVKDVKSVARFIQQIRTQHGKS